MSADLGYLKQTASQTAGPFVHIGLAPGSAGFDIYREELGHVIAGPKVEGDQICVEGRVIDGTGSPVKDVLLEVWQADAKGQYTPQPKDGFRGWGRVIPDFDTGVWRFETIKPGATTDPRIGRQAPHVSLWLIARGINTGLHTRLYFDDEPQANAADPVLSMIEWENRRSTLIAKRSANESKVRYHFDIVLQGPGETVFFDV